MEQDVSRFQERIASVIGGAILLSLSLRKRRPPWGGIALVGMGLLLLRGGLSWVHSVHDRERQSNLSEPELCELDIVIEGSKESFPASDPPAWVLGVR